MREDPMRVLIVESSDHGAVARALLAGARGVLEAADAEVEVLSVPGPLAIPPVIAMAEEGGHRPAGVRFDGYVALGCAIDPETPPSDIVARETARALMDLAIGRRLAIGIGVVAAPSESQALTRAQSGEGDMGAEAARACVALLAVRRRLLGQSR